MNYKSEISKSVTLLLAVLVLGACKDESDPMSPIDNNGPVLSIDRAVVVPLAATRMRQVVETVSEGIAFAESNDSFVSKLGNRVSSPPLVSKSSPPVMMMAKAMPPLRGFFGHPEKAHNPASLIVAATVGEEDTALNEDLGDLATQVEILLRDRLLAESNLESSTETSATYLLKPDPTCRPLPGDGDPATIDPDCAADLMKMPVRIVLSGERAPNGDEGVRLAILLGDARAELLALVVHENLVAVEINLVTAKQALDIANEAFSGTNDSDFMVDLTYSLQVTSGKLRFALSKLGPQKFNFDWSILDTVALSVLDDAQAPIFSFSSEKQPGPVLSLTGDGVAQVLQLAVDFGKTTLRTVWDPAESGVTNQDLLVSIGGFSLTTEISEATQELTIENLGFGNETTQVMVRNVPIFGLDLNRDSGRRANLRLTMNDLDQPRFEVSPELALRLLFNLQAVAAEIDDEDDPIADFLLDEVYSIVFAGAAPTVFEFVPEDPITMFDGGLRMVAGTLTLGNKAGPVVTVPADQCLVGSGEGETGEHGILGAFAAGMCM